MLPTPTPSQVHGLCAPVRSIVKSPARCDTPRDIFTDRGGVEASRLRRQKYTVASVPRRGVPCCDTLDTVLQGSPMIRRRLDRLYYPASSIPCDARSSPRLDQRPRRTVRTWILCFVCTLPGRRATPGTHKTFQPTLSTPHTLKTKSALRTKRKTRRTMRTVFHLGLVYHVICARCKCNIFAPVLCSSTTLAPHTATQPACG